jgi:hypothetical protein
LGALSKNHVMAPAPELPADFLKHRMLTL